MRLISSSTNQDYRAQMYSDWVDSGEKPVPGLNLRYLYDDDFKDWAVSRGEWSGRAQKISFFEFKK